jgi:hypothetical protein
MSTDFTLNIYIECDSQAHCQITRDLGEWLGLAALSSGIVLGYVLR